MTQHTRTRLTLAGLLLGALATVVPVAGAAAADEDGVLEAQDRRFKATVDADAPTLGALLTDDMTYTHSSAVVEDKAAFVESLTSGRADYRSIVPEERRVRLHGDAAVVAGTAHVLVTAGGNDIDVRLRFTEVYVRKGGQWRMLLWHSTRIP